MGISVPQKVRMVYPGMSDNWNFNASNPCLHVGGNYSQNGNHGMFHVNYNNTSNANGGISARSLYKPSWRPLIYMHRNSHTSW